MIASDDATKEPVLTLISEISPEIGAYILDNEINSHF
jgi:hypothetical protein